MALLLAIQSDKTPALVGFTLVLVWVFGTAAIWCFASTETQPTFWASIWANVSRHWIRSLICSLLLGFGLVLYGISVWPKTDYPIYVEDGFYNCQLAPNLQVVTYFSIKATDKPIRGRLLMRHFTNGVYYETGEKPRRALFSPRPLVINAAITNATVISDFAAKKIVLSTELWIAVDGFKDDYVIRGTVPFGDSPKLELDDNEGWQPRDNNLWNNEKTHPN